MSEDIKTHLETIRDIDGTGYRRGRERTQALEAVAASVADDLLTGRPVHVYKEVEGFFSINGFAEAVANAIVAQGNTAVDQRYALAKYVEEKGVEKGREAARILREMNAQSAVLPWGIPATPPAFFTPGDACDYDNETREDLARIRFGEDTDEDTTITCPIHLRGKAKLSLWMVNEAGERIGKKVKQTVELGGDDDTEAAEDAGPEYDTVSQNDIRAGDIVEYHWDGKVRRWEVLDVRENLIPGIGPDRARLRLIGEHNTSEISVGFPLLEDPFILRPRS